MKFEFTEASIRGVLGPDVVVEPVTQWGAYTGDFPAVALGLAGKWVTVFHGGTHYQRGVGRGYSPGHLGHTAPPPGATAVPIAHRGAGWEAFTGRGWEKRLLRVAWCTVCP